MKQTHHLAKTTAILLGFVTGFVFLLASFIGLGTALLSIFVSGIFFINTLAIISILQSSTKNITT